MTLQNHTALDEVAECLKPDLMLFIYYIFHYHLMGIYFILEFVHYFTLPLYFYILSKDRSSPVVAETAMC